MRKRLFFTLTIILFSFQGIGLCGESAYGRQLFYQGNAEYAQEDFRSAIEKYEQAIRLGYESGPLYYNLGNAYFKNDSLGKSILNYLRAERLMPRDADLASNLKFARSLIKGGAIPQEQAWFARMFAKFWTSFALGATASIGVIAYIILCALVVIMILYRRARRPLIYACVPVALVLALFTGAFYVNFQETAAQEHAVVLENDIESRFEPFDEATVFFTLNEGEDLVIMDSKQGWIKIKRSDGKQGWIEQEAVEAL
ncbi:tetratricopeptide repeat protein [Candidatus Omnitrophota bacterium]